MTHGIDATTGPTTSPPPPRDATRPHAAGERPVRRRALAAPRDPSTAADVEPGAAPPCYVHTAGRYERFVKPLVDRVGALLLLLVLLPLLLGLLLVVVLALGRPVIIRQRRIGRGGRSFGMFKLRTMRADRRLSAAAAWEGPERRQCHKHPDDPRHVPVGRFLRRWSLDELPQLLNVLLGDMSLVGPRPELEAVVHERYEPWQLARHQVKPGLTGLWQISARDRGLMYEHTALDLEYLRTLSAPRDLSILLRTVPAALGLRKGV